MQTHFTEEQLAVPDLARSNKILRSCVHCGLCTATCPTYQLLGDELDGPRGRIYLIKDMLEAGRPADAETVRHVDRCLGCLACMTTCPAGVHYGHLVDHARRHIAQTYRRPWHERALRQVLAQVLPYPKRFRAALIAAKVARPVRRLIPDARLRAMLDLVPKRIVAPGPCDAPAVFAPVAPRVGRVALLTGCAQKVLDDGINTATIRLLNRLGVEVVIPRGEGCCGALVEHMGKADQARAFARKNIAAWGREIDGEGLDAVIVNTSGCGTSVKDYGHLFEGHPEEADAQRVAGLTLDISEYLDRLDLPQQPARDLRVTYHAACSLQHGQKVVTPPKRLLARAGFKVATPDEAHLCCGSAGTYNILQPEIAMQLRDRKVDALAQTAPDVIVAGNIGCMTQIASGMETPVMHLIELLDWAYGGPQPQALAR